MSQSVIHPNVTIPASAQFGPFAVLGEPPRDHQPGDLRLTIGADSLIRSHCVIYAGTTCGDRLQTGHFAMIREHTTIGDDVSIGTRSVVEHHVTIGDGVRLHSGVFVPEFSVLEDGCWLGPNVTITNDRYPQSTGGQDRLQGVHIEAGAIIGANATLLPGVRIGARALVGAGAVVTADVPPGAVVVGNPAKVINHIDQIKAYPPDEAPLVVPPEMLPDAQPAIVSMPTRPLESVKRAAFNVTAAFEGAGYDSYQTFDTGIVSYGRFQFTLASGNLFAVVADYLMDATGSVANTLRNDYMTRIHDRDETLREDTRLKELLQAAAQDPLMQTAQDTHATKKYWDLVQSLSIQPRNIQSPLGMALLFDMAINHGPRHDMIGLAEEKIGVLPKSRMPENGASEADLITAVAKIRQGRLHKLADKHGWGGLRTRGDFWVTLCESGDWSLLGDADGKLEVKDQVHVPVRDV